MAIKINNIEIMDDFASDIILEDLNNIQGTYQGCATYGESGYGISDGGPFRLHFGGVHTRVAVSNQNITIIMPDYGSPPGAPRSGGNSGSNLNAHAGGGYSVLFDLSSNGYDITWPTEYKWPNDTEPDWTTARYWYVHTVCYSTSIIFATATPFDALST